MVETVLSQTMLSQATEMMGGRYSSNRDMQSTQLSPSSPITRSGLSAVMTSSPPPPKDQHKAETSNMAAGSRPDCHELTEMMGIDYNNKFRKMYLGVNSKNLYYILPICQSLSRSIVMLTKCIQSLRDEESI